MRLLLVAAGPVAAGSAAGPVAASSAAADHDNGAVENQSRVAANRGHNDPCPCHTSGAITATTATIAIAVTQPK